MPVYFNDYTFEYLPGRCVIYQRSDVHRQLFAMYASHYIIGLSPDDVVYCHLPLYHSSGGQVATCSSILFGTKTVIRKKFSASAFWKDCVGFNITVSTIIIITLLRTQLLDPFLLG